MPRLACEQAFGRAGNWGESWPTDHGQCCVVGLNGGGLFPLLCSLPKPASIPDVSLSMKIFAPRKAGRRKRLSSFSFLWLAYVANASARVSQAVPKLEPEEKKAFALSLCTFSRNNSSGHAWYAGYPDGCRDNRQIAITNSTRLGLDSRPFGEYCCDL